MTLLCIRFWAKVDHSGGPDACWPWTAGRNADGYGVIWVGRTMDLAHRVAWALVNGPIPPGLKVLHACDNPPCMNLAHFFLGTMADNTADMMAKGRDRHGVLLGEAHGRAKLSEAQVHEIRRLHAEERLNEPCLARRFDVGTSTIHRLLAGRAWSHV